MPSNEVSLQSGKQRMIFRHTNPDLVMDATYKPGGAYPPALAPRRQSATGGRSPQVPAALPAHG